MSTTVLDRVVSSPAQTPIKQLHVEIDQADVDDLRRRLEATRFPGKEVVGDPSQGVQLATIQELVRFWATDYDMRRVETLLNAFDQFTTEIDGLDIHFIHVKSRHEDAMPLILTHGWPGSVIEMLEVIGPLTDPTAHGGRVEDAFHVVIPSLPGYGFSGVPTEMGWNADRIARAWTGLMDRLGYTRYVAQGGDQGASVTDAMARQAPQGLVGIHLNLLASFPIEVLAAIFGGEFVQGFFKRVAVAAVASRAEKERKALEGAEATFMRGYIAEMNTRPQTIGYGQADSPAGLATWMLDHDPDSYEKISHAFLDGRASGGLTRERIVDNITLYWLTNTAASSARLYWENARSIAAAIQSGKKPPELSLPVGFTVFPGEVFQAPRSWTEKVYPNLVYFNEAPKGGHFAAWEEPQLFATELREAFRTMRGGMS